MNTKNYFIFILLLEGCGGEEKVCKGNYLDDTGICYKLIDYQITEDALNTLTNDILERASYHLDINSDILYNHFLANEINFIIGPKELLPDLKNEDDLTLGVAVLIINKSGLTIEKINISVRNDLVCVNHTYFHELLHVVYYILHSKNSVKQGSNYHNELYFGLSNNSLEDKLLKEINCEIEQ